MQTTTRTPSRNRLSNMRLNSGRRRRQGAEAEQPLNRVTILGKEAKMGSHIFDDLVDVTFTLDVDQEPTWRRGPPRPRQTGKALGEGEGEGEGEGRVEKAGAGGDAPRSARTVLRSDLALRVEVNIPMPLSKLPARVLRSGGGTLIRLVVQRMLKGFMVLLARDFESWVYSASSPERRAIGEDPASGGEEGENGEELEPES